jgi:hypothetical protein
VSLCVFVRPSAAKLLDVIETRSNELMRRRDLPRLTNENDQRYRSSRDFADVKPGSLTKVLTRLTPHYT